MKFFRHAFNAAILFLFLPGVCLSIFALPAEGVPAAPGVWTHTQSDGRVVSYQVRGDEFLNYLVDPNGNLLAFGEDGDLFYATWVREEDFRATLRYRVRRTPSITVPTSIRPMGLLSRAMPFSEDDMRPLRVPVPGFLLEHARNLRYERDSSWIEQFDSSSNLSMAPLAASGSIERNVVIIYVYFSDSGGVSSMQGLQRPSDQYLHNMMFNGSTLGTVAHYFSSVTNGMISIKPASTFNQNGTPNTQTPGIIVVELPGQHGNWRDEINPMSDNFFLLSALTKAADPANPGGFIDFSAFDTNGDGIIQSDELSIGFIVHGYETAIGGPNPAFPSVWGHAFSTSTQIITLNGVRIQRYFAQGAFHTRSVNPSQNPPQLLTIGVLAHELGHSAFGFIDLYDISYVGSGLGMWSLMAAGSWGGSPSGSIPTALDAFHLLGGNTNLQIAAPQPVTPGKNILSGLTQYARLNTTDPNQFFLIQPRGNVSYDTGFRTSGSFTQPWNSTGSGLLFLLVNNNLRGSNNLAANNHFRVAVVPANWNSPSAVYDVAGGGSSANLFSAATRTFINDNSVPSTMIYASVNNTFPTVGTGWGIQSITSSAAGLGTRTGTVTASFSATIPPLASIAPQITEHPKNQSASHGSRATFSATATGSAPLTFQWQRSSDSGYTWEDINDAITPTYSFTAFTFSDNAQFRLIVTNDLGSVTSDAATLTVTFGSGVSDQNSGNGGGSGCSAGFGFAALLTLAAVFRKLFS